MFRTTNQLPSYLYEQIFLKYFNNVLRLIIVLYIDFLILQFTVI